MWLQCHQRTVKRLIWNGTRPFVCQKSLKKSESTIDNVESFFNMIMQAVTSRPKQFGYWLCAAAVSLLLGRIGRWSGREIPCSALSLVGSVQVERDNESCFFVRVAGVHRFIRRYHIKRFE
ncbi:hypothetical protein EVAR_18298_1 [Eumeta japonica]|uniref:Uncharacterized protein n=1 Tax=Eumeta variegata TaxID=151549 RepID=A0A4C1V8S5_EUMVA|nr:hypothetical protein EVAR_18298_1 [Eumeta japonica]